jgi:hypothetical protein
MTVQQTLTVSNTESCDEMDLKEIEGCMSDLLGVHQGYIHATCPHTRRRPFFGNSLFRQSTNTITITVLGSTYEISQAVYDYLNSAEFLANLNAALTDSGIDVTGANAPSVANEDITGMLI